MPTAPPDRSSARASTRLAPLEGSVRRTDPDRFLTLLLAPASHRPALALLYAFNHELARAREVAREPMLALVRLQWWREVVQGARRQHMVATPLSEALEAGILQPGPLEEMIAGREQAIEGPMESLADWRACLFASHGAIAVAAAVALGASAEEAERVRPAGAAYGAGGMLRSLPRVRPGAVPLPAALLEKYGVSAEYFTQSPNSPPVASLRAELAAEARSWLGPRLALPRGARAAGLVGALARRDLAQPGVTPAPRGLGEKLAVVRGAMTGRV